MEAPLQISWICYGCFETVYSYLGKTAPCHTCEPTRYEEDDPDGIFYTHSCWVNATGVEITSRSDQLEQDAAWEEYDLRMDLLEQEWSEAMEDDRG